VPVYRTGAEELRLIVTNLGHCREGFLDRYSAEQLLAIGRAQIACDWDIFPDQWTPKQIRGALLGRVPLFDDDGRPL